MARKPRKQMKYTRVLATYVLDADNMDLLAGMLGQKIEDMAHAYTAAELMSSEIHITEYQDRYQLDLVKKADPNELQPVPDEV